jgi:hypothetical protein
LEPPIADQSSRHLIVTCGWSSSGSIPSWNHVLRLVFSLAFPCELLVHRLALLLWYYLLTGASCQIGHAHMLRCCFLFLLLLLLLVLIFCFYEQLPTIVSIMLPSCISLFLRFFARCVHIQIFFSYVRPCHASLHILCQSAKFSLFG